MPGIIVLFEQIMNKLFNSTHLITLSIIFIQLSQKYIFRNFNLFRALKDNHCVNRLIFQDT